MPTSDQEAPSGCLCIPCVARRSAFHTIFLRPCVHWNVVKTPILRCPEFSHPIQPDRRIAVVVRSLSTCIRRWIETPCFIFLYISIRAFDTIWNYSSTRWKCIITSSSSFDDGRRKSVGKGRAKRVYLPLFNCKFWPLFSSATKVSPFNIELLKLAGKVYTGFKKDIMR